MFKIFALALLVGLTLSASFGGSQYESQTRQQKMTQLWNEITKDTTPGSFPSGLKLGGIFVESMTPTFDHRADTLPDGRVKYIHSVGVVGQVQLIPEPNQPYSGVFSGSDSVLLRLSCAKAPDTSKTSPSEALDNFTPGLGIKFLRDGQPSANVVAMYGVNGFDSWNFFAKDASNHIPSASGVALTLVATKFSSATPRIQTIGLKDLAAFNQNGEPQEPKFPFQIFFRATPEVQGMFSDYFNDSYMNQLQEIPAGTTLYELLAVDAPNGCPVKIGTIRTVTKFTSSKFSDEQLFFKHNWMEDDLKDHPDWDDYVPQFSFFKGSTVKKESKCPFGY